MFETLSRAICTATGAKWGAVSKADFDQGVMNVLAIASEGEILEPFQFPLKGSPCEQTLADPARPNAAFGKSLLEHFPNFDLGKQLSAESYRGQAFFGPNGRSIGNVVALHDEPFASTSDLDAFFQIVAQTAATELNRLMAIEHSQMLESLFHSAPFLTAIVNKSHELVYANQKYIDLQSEALFESKKVGGLKPFSNLIGKELYEKKFKEHIAAAFATQSTQTLQTTEKGRTFQTTMNFCEDRNCVMIYTQDQTKEIADWDSILDFGIGRNPLNTMIDVAKAASNSIKNRLGAESVELFMRNRSDATFTNLLEENQIVESDGPLIGEILTGLRVLKTNTTTLKSNSLVDVAQQTSLTEQETKEFNKLDHDSTNLAIAPLSNGEQIVGFAVVQNQSNTAWDIGQLRFLERSCHVIATLFANKRESELESKLLNRKEMEYIGALSLGLVHDFNNQLIPILLGLDLAAETFTESPDLKESINAAQSAAEQAQEICRTVTDFTGNCFSKDLIELAELVKGCERLLARMVNGKADLEIVTEENSADLQLKANPTQIYQAVINLTLNALESIDHDQGKISIHFYQTVELPNIQLKHYPGVSYCAIEVKDNGRGIVKSQVEQLNSLFVNSMENSVGIGLAIVGNSVKSHDGHLHFESEIGSGTTATILLPVRNSNPLMPVRIDRASSITNTNSNQDAPEKLRILLVDDKDDVRDAVSKTLSELGHIVHLADDGVHAVSAVESNFVEFDLVLMDVLMKIMNGDVAFSKIKSIKPKLPIVLMSGFAERTPLNPEIPFIAKPFSRSELKSKIMSVVN